MAFPFLEDVCIGRTGHYAGVFDERLRQRGEQFDKALSLVRRANRRLGGNRRSEQLQLIARIPKLRRIELCKIVAAIGSDDVLDDTCGVCVSMISAS